MGCSAGVSSSATLLAGTPIGGRRDDLDAMLGDHGVAGITGVDTRRLTRLIRTTGAVPGAFGPAEDLDAVRAAAAAEPGTDGIDLVATVTTAEPYTVPAVNGARRHIVAYDYGIKRTILRHLARSGRSTSCRRRLPPTRRWLANPTASSCPTDPAIRRASPAPPTSSPSCSARRSRCSASASAISCSATALGGTTVKLPFGHHGANHPVQDVATGKIEITSQNHNFAVAADGLASIATVTHVNLNDGVCEGLEAIDANAFSVQHHPEAGPGPHDSAYLFERFAAADGRERVRSATARRHHVGARHRLGPDRHRPGVRVRLLRHAGVPGAARGGLPGHPRQLQPGDDHDRPGLRRPHLRRAADGDVLAAIIERERPDAVLPTLGGQTGLNLAMELSRASGSIGVPGTPEMLGADATAIATAEDREQFKAAMVGIGLDVPASGSAHSLDEAPGGRRRRSGCRRSSAPPTSSVDAGPASPATAEEFHRLAAAGLAASPIGEILIEESIAGWKEFELEVMRDRADNCVIICSIENVDPMGVHTGDSITVAPAQTLSDVEYQEMRNAAFACIRRVGVETGGSNVQFALDPDDRAPGHHRDESRVRRARRRWPRRRPASRSPRSPPSSPSATRSTRSPTTSPVRPRRASSRRSTTS